MKIRWLLLCCLLLLSNLAIAGDTQEFTCFLPAETTTNEVEFSVNCESFAQPITRNFGVTRADEGVTVRFLEEKFAGGQFLLKVAVTGEKAAWKREAVVWVKVAGGSNDQLLAPLPAKTFKFRASPPQSFQIFTREDDKGEYEKPLFVHCRIFDKVSGSDLFSQIFPKKDQDSSYPVFFQVKNGQTYVLELSFTDQFGRASKKTQPYFRAFSRP